MPWLHVLGSHLRFILLLLQYWLYILTSLLYFISLYVSMFSDDIFLLQDLEFVQFHPTGIYGAGCLITEGWYFLCYFGGLLLLLVEYSV